MSSNEIYENKLNLSNKFLSLFPGKEFVVKASNDIVVPINNCSEVSYDNESKLGTSKFEFDDQDIPEEGYYALLGDFSVNEDFEDAAYPLPGEGIAEEYGLGCIDSEDDELTPYDSRVIYYCDKIPDEEFGYLYRLYEFDRSGWIEDFEVDGDPEELSDSDYRFRCSWRNIDQDHGLSKVPDTVSVTNKQFRGLEVRMWEVSEDRKDIVIQFFNPQTYVMTDKDSLSSIAYRYNVSLEDLKKANNIEEYESDYARIGTKLLLPRSDVKIDKGTEIILYMVDGNYIMSLDEYWNIINNTRAERVPDLVRITYRPKAKTYANLIAQPSNIWKQGVCSIKYGTYNIVTTIETTYDDPDEGQQTYTKSIERGPRYYIRKEIKKLKIDNSKLKKYKEYLMNQELKKTERNILKDISSLRGQDINIVMRDVKYSSQTSKSSKSKKTTITDRAKDYLAKIYVDEVIGGIKKTGNLHKFGVNVKDAKTFFLSNTIDYVVLYEWTGKRWHTAFQGGKWPEKMNNYTKQLKKAWNSCTALSATKITGTPPNQKQAWPKYLDWLAPQQVIDSTYHYLMINRSI